MHWIKNVSFWSKDYFHRMNFSCDFIILHRGNVNIMFRSSRLVKLWTNLCSTQGFITATENTVVLSHILWSQCSKLYVKLTEMQRYVGANYCGNEGQIKQVREFLQERQLVIEKGCKPQATWRTCKHTHTHILYKSHTFKTNTYHMFILT